MEEPEDLPSPISALREDRIKDRQNVNHPERIVLPQWVGGRLLAHPFCLFPLGSTTSSCTSPMDPHTTEGKQDSLLSQEISEIDTGFLCESWFYHLPAL